MTALGTVFRPQFPPEILRGMAEAADDSALDQLWVWEDCFSESGVASAAAALAWTERVSVGIGLLPVPLRNVALAAMEAATLHRLFPDRVILGVGHGLQVWMGQAGARVSSPLTLLREYLDALRALLRGEEVTVDGTYVKLDKVRLDWPPLKPVPVFAGGIGPKTLRLTGEAADGTLAVADQPADGVRRIRETVGPTQPIIAALHVTTGPDAAERLARAVPSGVGVAGDAETVAAAVRTLAAVGADTVVLQPTGDEPDPVGFVRFVADEVRPLVP
ncbi:LLM class flavin-dependent oxidoreductase [Kutzneria buriramensis]|uniref:Alkanesulfonate monooxygenase SsuD/methylene tetrahydromethanopterin reductase-like flavin-dependent oxidoreductase (Luciferase family) n=1 Tax=Kutzneria buriramensis TaxID=1045776 RepID=A0A3E0GWT0_9PSEU|nr:LLM class flavin-dependent oxidoreductase [Kutzneria buriramensis]REH32595.1 alkanesulfonate monooxygenase SsuD/methylene tetrahydromethanopterin reductase-like flavin-dependent oxidoreductase (luciferase family) [Kutzneria buriramensis]